MSRSRRQGEESRVRSVRRVARAGLLLAVAAISLASCRPTADDLARTLPTELNGEATRIVAVHDTMSGLVIDDALTALGEDVSDASLAIATAPSGIVVIATAVQGIPGARLLEALTSTWPVAGPAENVTVAGRSVERSATNGGGSVSFYLHGEVVYVVEAADEERAAVALGALP